MTHDEFDKLLANATPHVPKELPDVSLIRLLANPELYNGKFVRVNGFLVLEFEGTALYLHREDCEQILMRNAVWLDVPSEVWERKYELTERYVVIEGVFRADCRGHMDAFGGAINPVQDIRPTHSREEISRFLERERNKK
ncbi:MAG: hypothetical protein WAQ52_16635 [Terriglobales bacterium]